jgi:hypothetical protein
VVLRIWLVLLALLMLAAPADIVGETAEISSAAAADDETLIEAIVVKLDETPPRRVRVIRVGETIPPTPAPAGVFRPPRPTLD